MGREGRHKDCPYRSLRGRRRRRFCRLKVVMGPAIVQSLAQVCEIQATLENHRSVMHPKIGRVSYTSAGNQAWGAPFPLNSVNLCET